MAVTKGAAGLGGLCCGILAWAVVGSAWAQDERPRLRAARGAPDAARAEPPSGEVKRPAPSAAAEPQFPKSYGPLDAAREAYQRAETERLRAIDRQLGLMDDMVWYSGIGGYDRPSLEALYAFGRPGPFRRSLGSAYRYWARPYADYLPRSVFQPWPLVPGDIYGYPYLNMVEQPLGYRLIWTGPNSYIYRPVYQSDLTPAERPPEAAGPSEPEKPQAEPILAPPAIEKPRPEPVPAPAPVPAPRHGPREF